MFKNSVMKLSTVLLMLAAITAAFAQTPQSPQELHQRYGSPDESGRYEVRPGVLMTVKYAGEGQRSEIVIEPRQAPSGASADSVKLIPAKMGAELLDEVVPSASRGRRLVTVKSQVQFKTHEVTEYEGIMISVIKEREDQGGDIHSIKIIWKK